MRVLNWAQTRLHGAYCSEQVTSEFSSGSRHSAAAAAAAETCIPRGPRRDNDGLHGGWHPAMLSIGTLGIAEGHGDDKLAKMQEELMLLMSARGVTPTVQDQDKRPHLTLKGSLDAGIVKHRSFRKFMSSFLPRPIFREKPPELRPAEIPWPLPHNDIPSDNWAMSEATIKSYRTAHLPWRSKATGEEQGSKWIRTDSEYIVLEI